MPVQTRSMKAKSSNDEQPLPPSSLDNSIRTRLQKKNSIFEPRPFKLLKMQNKKPPRCDSMVSAFIQETEECEWLMQFNKVLISACSFLSFIVMYAMIFHVIELNCAQLNITTDILRLIYGAVWSLLLVIGFNFESHKTYLPIFE
jgi:hypothetical protein